MTKKYIIIVSMKQPLIYKDHPKPNKDCVLEFMIQKMLNGEMDDYFTVNVMPLSDLPTVPDVKVLKTTKAVVAWMDRALRDDSIPEPIKETIRRHKARIEGLP